MHHEADAGLGGKLVAHVVVLELKRTIVRFCSSLLPFLSAARTSDLGTLGVLLLFVAVGGGAHFRNIPMCSFLKVCSKVAIFFNIISKPK